MNNFTQLIAFVLQLLASFGLTLTKDQLRQVLLALVDQVLEPMAASTETRWDDLAVRVLRRVIESGVLFDRLLDEMFERLPNGENVVFAGEFTLSPELESDIQSIVAEDF